jgi:hypothetical protein
LALRLRRCFQCDAPNQENLENDVTRQPLKACPVTKLMIASKVQWLWDRGVQLEKNESDARKSRGCWNYYENAGHDVFDQRRQQGSGSGAESSKRKKPAASAAGSRSRDFLLP